MGKFSKGVKKAAKSLKPSEVKKNPAAAVGTVVGAGVAAAGHPWLATVAAAGAEKLADKAIPAVKTRLQEFTDAHGLSTPQAPQIAEEDTGFPPNPFK